MATNKWGTVWGTNVPKHDVFGPKTRLTGRAKPFIPSNRASPDFIVDEQSSLEPKIHFTFGAFAKSPGRTARDDAFALRCNQHRCPTAVPKPVHRPVVVGAAFTC
jgi:hypothetical protein